MIMITKKEIKYIQSLYHKKTRDEEGLFIAEGPKMIAELLHAAYPVKALYATSDWIANNPGRQAIEVAPQDLQKMSQLQTPHQVLALVQQKKQGALSPLQGQITLALDTLQDPGNLGTIIRIADWFGIAQIVASPNTADVYNSKVLQATMGSFLRVNIFYTPLHAFLAQADVPVFGALLNGVNIHTVPKPQEAVLVIGNESRGINDTLMPYITKPVTIPRLGNAESLNAAVATGIILSRLCS